MKTQQKLFSIIAFILVLNACESSQQEDSTRQETSTSKRNIESLNINFSSTSPIQNRSAYIPSQCYTKTKDEQGNVHNPCYSCHINSVEPNYINDADLQEEYAFSEYSKINRFNNLFKDRTDLVSQINNQEIIRYVKEDNYLKNNQIILSEKLKNLPSSWDVNQDGVWNGYTPDSYFNFNQQGFDIKPNGEPTGWRAFAYYPFLGTFWPTNGSTDDVLIRLPEVFRQDASSQQYNEKVYRLNLAIVESLIKRKDIKIDAVDEQIYLVDLNQNGQLDIANNIVYKWQVPSYDNNTKTLSHFSMRYVGMARAALQQNSVLIAPGLYPKGTEFLHSVRYLDIDLDKQTVGMASRMKELRYAKKQSWNTYSQLSSAALSEIKEKDLFPDRLRTIKGNTETGLKTGLGWVYQGFIEDKTGQLRPQNYEESLNCIGCHSGVGVVTDSTYAFPRKFGFTSQNQGWYYWSQNSSGFKNIKEPKTAAGIGEYTEYLKTNHAGDEFRANDEVIKRFFNSDQTIKQEAIDKLSNDITYLIVPSVDRALDLNKAYKVIVEEQSYIYGRDAHIKPLKNVHKELIIGTKTGVVH